MPPFERNWAFFLDLDGTLLDLAETPEAVDPGPQEIALLRNLHRACGGALALITGVTVSLMQSRPSAAEEAHREEMRDPGGDTIYDRAQARAAAAAAASAAAGK
ncbi:MAG: hypothetical protein ACREUE_17110 [Panacagrimonas sp.]